MSDLHLESYPDFHGRKAEGASVLVLAGDVGSYQRGSRLEGKDFGLERFSPRRRGSPWERVLYLPGNHEFDGRPYQDTYDELRSLCENLDITWIESEVVTVDGVRFVGSTLWSDFDALALGEKTLAARLKARNKAFRAANYYLSKNSTLIDGAPALAEQIRELGLRSQAWLRTALSLPFDGTTVAVTHFAPSLRSADPRYGLAPGTAGFCNGLDDLLPLAQVWMHGHLHCPSDYEVEGFAHGRAARCRVVANPRGYASKGEQDAFREEFTIEIPPRE